MKCDICDREEKEFKDKFIPVIKSFQNQIKQIEDDIQKAKEKYAEDNGFSKINFDKVTAINKNILEMKINAFLENKESFLNLDPNLEILNTYLTKYHPHITQNSSLHDLSEMFILEPTESRYSNLIYGLISKKDTLAEIIEIIKNKNGVFNIIEIPFSSLGFENGRRSTVENAISTFFENGEEIIKPKKLFLCPYCSYLFATSSAAAYEVKHAHDNDYEDWGDDDDDY